MAILRYFIIHMDAWSPPVLLVMEDQWRAFAKPISFICFFLNVGKKS